MNKKNLKTEKQTQDYWAQWVLKTKPKFPSLEFWGEIERFSKASISFWWLYVLGA